MVTDARIFADGARGLAARVSDDRHVSRGPEDLVHEDGDEGAGDARAVRRAAGRDRIEQVIATKARRI